MTRILEPTDSNLLFAAEALRRGEVVGMPTETVYGLAGSVFDESALARIFAVKERPVFDPLIVHVSPAMAGGADAADPLAALAGLRLVDLPALSPLARSRATALCVSFWPGPLTLVLAKNPAVPELATSGLATVGIRLPRHPVAQKLIDAARSPLAAPSANRFGRISPTSAQAVAAELGGRIELILDGGLCDVGLESTVVSVLADGTITILRPGAISQAEVERATGAAAHLATASYEQTKAQAAPGMLESHYAPQTPLYRLPKPLNALARADLSHLPQPARGPVGLLVMAGDSDQASHKFKELTGFEAVCVSLSVGGLLPEMARNLFQALRTLDASGVAAIYAEPSPEAEGLGHAIADRLKRASRA